jgi:hypothetical protein
MTKQILIWGSIAGALVSIMLFVTMIFGAGKLVYETKDAAVEKEADCKDRAMSMRLEIREYKTKFDNMEKMQEKMDKKIDRILERLP